MRDHREVPIRCPLFPRHAVAALAALAAGAGGALALGERAEPPAAQAATGVPTLADVEGYARWLRLRTAYAGGSTAHRGTKVVYVSNAAAARRSRGKRGIVYPKGTRIVKTATRATADGRRFLALVAIMEKVRATGPAGKRASDWRWAEYTRSSRGAPLRLVAGGDQGLCTGCHDMARRTDFSFTRLR